MELRAIFFLVLLTLTQAKVLELSCKKIQQFVDGHNERRLRIAKGELSNQPAASVMNSMVWDNELAAKAQKWVSKNKIYHNPDKTIGSARFTTGENIYWYSTTDHKYNLDINAPLDSWFDEYKDFTYGTLNPSDFGGSPAIGHYTQMAWSDSTHLGCAVSQVEKKGWTNFFVVCNYGPAGNYLGQTPYVAGRGESSGELTCGVEDCSQKYGTSC